MTVLELEQARDEGAPSAIMTRLGKARSRVVGNCDRLRAIWFDTSSPTVGIPGRMGFLLRASVAT